MPNHIFTYGSLIFHQVWSVVVRGTYRSDDARLSHFKRRCVKGATYPAIIPEPNGESVNGRIYFDVSDQDVRRLDIFEGQFYKRDLVDCAVGSEIFPAHAYIFRNQFLNLVSDQPWDPAWFARVGIHQFLQRYNGFARTAF